MQLNSKTLQKNQIDLEIEISIEEMKPFIDKAVLFLAQEVKIDGFRPEKIPFGILKRHIGEMTIYEKAAELAIEKTYPKIVKDEHLETIGSPQISIIKLAPGNPFVYKATASLMPHVRLGDYKKIKVEKKKVEVEEKKVEEVLKDLQKMQTKEILVKRPAKREDKIVVNMDIFLDKVPIEGGQAKNHSVYLNEPYYVPGFTDQLIGAAEGETKEFSLPFPKEHFNKHLAGKNVEFKIKIISVFELQLPSLDDNFAKTLGQATLADLKNLIRQNLIQEMENKENLRCEEEILKQIVTASRFDDIPEILINTEAHKMIHELEDALAEKGINFHDYLKNIKKTEGDLLLDFAPKAVERIKTAIVIKEIAAIENIEVTQEEINEEVKKLSEYYEKEPEIVEKVQAEESRDYLRKVIQNRKTIQLLKNLAIKS